MSTPTLKELCEKADKDYGKSLQEMRARLSPSTMLAVVEALGSCRWAKVAGAHPTWCMKYDETKVKSALNLLNGKAP